MMKFLQELAATLYSRIEFEELSVSICEVWWCFSWSECCEFAVCREDERVDQSSPFWGRPRCAEANSPTSWGVQKPRHCTCSDFQWFLLGYRQDLVLLYYMHNCTVFYIYVVIYIHTCACIHIQLHICIQSICAYVICKIKSILSLKTPSVPGISAHVISISLKAIFH